MGDLNPAVCHPARVRPLPDWCRMVSALHGGGVSASATVPALARPSRRLPRPAATAAPAPILLAAAILLAGLGGLLAYALIPQATVVLYPIGQPVAETLEIRADPSLAAGDPARARGPARVGRLAAQLAVLNEEPTVGGGQSSTPLVVEADVARVRKLAADHARSDALSKLQGEVAPEESLVLQTLDFTTLEERLDHRPGDQVGSFNYRLRARVSGALVASGDIERAVRSSWRPSLPPGYSLPPAQL